MEYVDPYLVALVRETELKMMLVALEDIDKRAGDNRISTLDFIRAKTQEIRSMLVKL